ncbi:olfactory receptor class A-like protein 1 [Amia ocellicauda]|uniref:olfactory receptor class A-like protein 1 n=1 Tax=Amia ocellicauda TaxID=2972642 RepID=UPI003464CBB6
MEVRLVLKAAGFICLDVVGIPGNLTVLLFFYYLRLSEGRLLPNDLILIKLAFVNLVVVLCRGIPQALTALGIRNLFGDNGCKVVIYIYRVSRAMSICITSLLSCYQCIVIAPGSTRWMVLKQRVPRSIPLIILLLYGMNIIIYPTSLLFTSAVPNSTISEYTLNMEFCIVVFPGFQTYMACGMIYILRDLTFMGIMVSAGFYIVLILYRHRKQMRGMHGSDQNQRKTVEASKSVLMLVTMYAILFGLDNVLWVYTLCVTRVHPAVSDTRVFFASCYSALSPVFIIATNKKFAARLNCFSHGREEKSNTTVTTISHIPTGL